MPYWVTNTFFQPFNDTAFYYGKTNRNLTVSGGINTTPIDQFREGVSLRTISDIYRTMQLKIVFEDGAQSLETKPNGELTHQSTFVTFGQSGDITQYTSNAAFNDSIAGVEGTTISGSNRISRTALYLIETGLIVDGVLPQQEVFPIYLNGGPQYREEAIIEPLGIPNRLYSNESLQEPVKGVFAFLESGNEGDERRFGTDIVEQMQYRTYPTTYRAFLEQGADYILVTGSYGVVTNTVDTAPNNILDQSFYSKITPWLEEENGEYFPELLNATDLLSVPVTSSTGIVQPFYANNYEISDSELQTRDQKSTTAGYSYYGGNASIYGTDSIAFGGYYRGS